MAVVFSGKGTRERGCLCVNCGYLLKYAKDLTNDQLIHDGRDERRYREILL
jgi:hypothetical protein